MKVLENTFTLYVCSVEVRVLPHFLLFEQFLHNAIFMHVCKFMNSDH